MRRRGEDDPHFASCQIATRPGVNGKPSAPQLCSIEDVRAAPIVLPLVPVPFGQRKEGGTQPLCHPASCPVFRSAFKLRRARRIDTCLRGAFKVDGAEGSWLQWRRAFARNVRTGLQANRAFTALDSRPRAFGTNFAARRRAHVVEAATARTLGVPSAERTVGEGRDTCARSVAVKADGARSRATIAIRKAVRRFFTASVGASVVFTTAGRAIGRAKTIISKDTGV